MRFEELPLHDATKRALEAMGFEEATPIQAETIPALLEGRDLIAQAQTGTGKTAAFGIPLIEAARTGRRGLVLTPTRELAVQVQRELQAIGKGSPVDVVCIIGGAHFGDQVRAIQRHPDAIIVATPGRVRDHMGRGTIDLGAMSLLVLDEADEMLSMGFQEEVDAIIAALPQERQTMLFSATVPASIERLARSALRDPVTIRATGSTRGAAKSVRQCFALVPPQQRADAVRRILAVEDPKAVLLFCRTRQRVEDLARELESLGADALHGGMGQPVRDAVMRRFRDGTTWLLVATDVAARGLDVEDIELVLHDDTAGDADTYIHRVGRTGRAGRTGTSIVLLTQGAMRHLAALQHVAGRLERYTVPDDAAIADAQATNLVAGLAAVEPGDVGRAMLERALAQGMELHDVAVRALELVAAAAATATPASAEPAPDEQGSVGLALKVGLMDGVRAGDILGMLLNAGGLRPEDVGRIDILQRLSVAEVPAGQAPRLENDLQRQQLRGQWVRPRLAADWRFKSGRR